VGFVVGAAMVTVGRVVPVGVTVSVAEALVTDPAELLTATE
jgi:hypothetical protein